MLLDEQKNKILNYELSAKFNTDIIYRLNDIRHGRFDLENGKLTKKEEAKSCLNNALSLCETFLSEGNNYAYWQMYKLYLAGELVSDRKIAWQYLQKGVDAVDYACIGEMAIMYMLGDEQFDIKQDIQMAKDLLNRTVFLFTDKHTRAQHEISYESGVRYYMAIYMICEKFGGLGNGEDFEKRQKKQALKKIKYYMNFSGYTVKSWAKPLLKKIKKMQ